METSRTASRPLVVLLLAALGAVLCLQAIPSYHRGHTPDYAVTMAANTVSTDVTSANVVAADVEKAAGFLPSCGKERTKPPAHPAVLSRSASNRLLLPSDRGQLATCDRGADPGAGGSTSASSPGHPAALRPGAITALLQAFRC
ncbi:MAG: hypothetical protein JO362_01950 [Streptomycetaceae bacterium]|nr:hypothetical protein [Streptomycetaceae bacterium]